MMASGGFGQSAAMAKGVQSRGDKGERETLVGCEMAKVRFAWAVMMAKGALLMEKGGFRRG